MKQQIVLTVNDEQRELFIDTRKTLVEVLREDLHLTGSKQGCDEGNCGSCTVIVDGKSAKACLMLALQAHSRDVLTIEGLDKSGELHPVQQAIIDNFGLQCGFCTPGMIMSLKALFDHNPKPTEKEIRHALVGNLCRCTGYHKIVASGKALAAGA